LSSFVKESLWRFVGFEGLSGEKGGKSSFGELLRPLVRRAHATERRRANRPERRIARILLFRKRLFAADRSSPDALAARVYRSPAPRSGRSDADKFATRYDEADQSLSAMLPGAEFRSDSRGRR
jgi:hypothetical protein